MPASVPNKKQVVTFLAVLLIAAAASAQQRRIQLEDLARIVTVSDPQISPDGKHNPNVFYELAVRHAVEKPIIHVIDGRWKIPFDVGPFRTIKYDLTDPDSIHNAVKELKDQAEQVRSGNWGETPIKLANIMRRTEGDTPQMLLLKEALEGISNVAARLTSVESAVRPTPPAYVWQTATMRDLGIHATGFTPGMLTYDNANALAARVAMADSGASERLPALDTGAIGLIQPPGGRRKRKFAYAPRSKRGGVVEAPPKPDSKKDTGA